MNAISTSCLDDEIVRDLGGTYFLGEDAFYINGKVSYFPFPIASTVFQSDAIAPASSTAGRGSRGVKEKEESEGKGRKEKDGKGRERKGWEGKGKKERKG